MIMDILLIYGYYGWLIMLLVGWLIIDDGWLVMIVDIWLIYRYDGRLIMVMIMDVLIMG